MALAHVAVSVPQSAGSAAAMVAVALACGLVALRVLRLPEAAGRHARRRRMGTVALALAAGALVAGACGSSDDGSSSDATEASTTTAANDATTTTAEAAGSELDLTALPLGDGKYTDVPEAGYLYACNPDGGTSGAMEEGPWIDLEAGTWNMHEKAVVPGEVSWPQATWDDVVEGDTRALASLDLPVDHTTGEFPIPADSEAYQYDRNPNAIEEQDVELSVPVEPELLDEPRCVGGEVGITTTGVLLFNAFDAGERDAVAIEVQDSCDGHPQVGGFYHYHGPSECVEAIEQESPTGEHSELQGYAFDGYGIFGVYGEAGELLSSADLDECHGHTHEIEWEGETVAMFHYHLTPDFPYSVSCFRAEPQVQALTAGEGPAGGGPPP